MLFTLGFVLLIAALVVGVAGVAEAVKGGAKKTVGRVTGSRHLRAEGRGDQIKGNAKQAGAKIKDACKH